MRILVFAVLLTVALARAQQREEEEGLRAEEEDRDKRQSFLPRAATPLPKGVPFPQQLRFPPPQAFRSAAPVDEDEELNHNIVTPTPAPYRRPQDTQRDFQTNIPSNTRGPPPPLRRPPPPPQGGRQPPLPDELLEEELEEEKPDRLSLLLPQSKFDCNGKKTGYYADDGLNCEVFHYCQDNAKHSWICPEGFLFHQVHLICMPPSSENICKQSSQFHFVNDYLYRPINQEEAQTKPNVTLRYSDRYYPDNYYEEEPNQQRQAAPAPVPVQIPQRGRPQPPFRPQPNQVFHSPEEVNIPLQQRRPGPPPPPPPQPQRGGFPHDDEFEYDDLPFRQG